MKQQIANRLGVAHVRDTVMQLVAGSITREQAMESLEIGKMRLYELKASYLAARAKGIEDHWIPGRSGGDHAAPWPEEEQRFLKRVLSPDGGAKRFHTHLRRVSWAGVLDITWTEGRYGIGR